MIRRWFRRFLSEMTLKPPTEVFNALCFGSPCINTMRGRRWRSFSSRNTFTSFGESKHNFSFFSQLIQLFIKRNWFRRLCLVLHHGASNYFDLHNQHCVKLFDTWIRPKSVDATNRTSNSIHNSNIWASGCSRKDRTRFRRIRVTIGLGRYYWFAISHKAYKTRSLYWSKSS